MTDSLIGKSMAREALQLALDFPHRPALGLEDFFVSSSNKPAIELIDQWPNWPALCVYLEGPASCGKSHLAHVWQVSSDARIESAATMDAGTVEEIENCVAPPQAIVIEDLANGILDEAALFHLINLAKEKSFHILFNGTMAPGLIQIDLPDLRSRIRALPVVRIEQPDEMLLRTMLLKQFQDRQIEIQPNLIEYIFPRMERSFEGAYGLVELLDKSALQSGRRITRQFAGEIFRSLDEASGLGG